MKPGSFFLLVFVLLVAFVLLLPPVTSAEPTNDINLLILERAEQEQVPAVIIESAHIKVALKQYQEVFGAYPTGDNRAVIGALMGRNVSNMAFLKVSRTNQQGELIDPWETPYSIGFESNIVIMKSAGPDKIPGNADDLVRVENQSMGGLKAKVTLKPEALEVSPGILTAFVRLPEGYPVSGITSATCDGAQPERMMPNEDGTEMIMKFRRKDIEEALRKRRETLDTYFVVRGTWQGAGSTHFFLGVASIKKIVGEKEKKK